MPVNLSVLQVRINVADLVIVIGLIHGWSIYQLHLDVSPCRKPHHHRIRLVFFHSTVFSYCWLKCKTSGLPPVTRSTIPPAIQAPALIASSAAIAALHRHSCSATMTKYSHHSSTRYLTFSRLRLSRYFGQYICLSFLCRGHAHLCM